MDPNIINTVSISAVKAKDCGISWEGITPSEVMGNVDQWTLH